MNATRPSDDAAMAGAGRARALLIIEDDPPIWRALRNALGEVAERLLEAPTGKTGIDTAATERPGQRERDAIHETLRQTDGRLAQAARRLGISRTTLWRRLRTEHRSQKA